MATKRSKNLLSTEQAAEYLGLSVDSVRRYCNDKEPKLRGEKWGRDWRIPKAELDRFKAERKPVGRPSDAA